MIPRLWSALRAYTDRHRTQWLIAALVLPLAAFWGFYAAVNAAHSKGICRVADPEQLCWTATHAAREFRAGHYTRAHGIPVRKVYRHPAAARTVWLRKIDRWLTRHPHKAALLRQSTGRHLSSGGDGSTCPPDVTGLACDLYHRAVFEATCVSEAPDPTNAPGICTVFDRPYIDLATIKRAGAVTFCGGAVVIGVAAAPAGGGSMFVAGWGASSCLFSLWASSGN